MRIWRDKDGKLIRGHQPTESTLDRSNPPKGGSDVILSNRKEKRNERKNELGGTREED